MKFFAVFAAVIAVASATPSTWTLQQLSEALENPTIDVAFKPTLEQALNMYMDAIFQGIQNPIKISTTAGVAATFTLAQLDYSLQFGISSNSVFKPYLEIALNEMMEALFTGSPMETIDIYVPAFELSYWTLNEIDEALSDPTTDKALVPYLENALNTIMFDLVNGGKQTATLLIVPANLVESSPVVAPSPVAVGPQTPAAPATPVSNSPLVQIVLNIQQSNVVDEVSPAHVIDRPLPEPSNESPIDMIAVLPVEELHPSPVPVVGPMV